MTLEIFVVEQVVPTLDGMQRANGEDQSLFNVIDESDGSRGDPVSFRLVKDLAGGASARIYKSYTRDENALKPIAIKRIEAASFRGFDDEFKQLIDRERTALSALKKHKNFVTEYYGYYYHAPTDEHWLAMEFCDGASLYHLIPYLLTDLYLGPKPGSKKLLRFSKNTRTPYSGVRKRTRSKAALGFDPRFLEKEAKASGKPLKTVNLKQIAAIAAGALRGLEVIHNAGFIHGDIKSGNILLCYPGVVKICDFGLTSKVVGVKNPDYHALGTLDYMAPEQMLKSLALDHRDPNPQRYKYDHRIDIWALGVVLLELLLGRTPLSDLRKIDEDEFSFYVAEMCQPDIPQNNGSGLGLFFYLSERPEDLMRGNWAMRDRDRLCSRFPVLRTNKAQMLELLMRPNLYNRRPNPAAEPPRAKVAKLFTLNKCLDFIGQCMFIRYKMRPDSKALQKHAFVKTACKEWKSLDNKIESLSKLQRRRSNRKKLWRQFRCSLTVHEIFNVLESYKDNEKDEILKATL